MSTTTPASPVYCTAWGKHGTLTEMFCTDRHAPKDQVTMHIADSSEQRALCRARVYKILPYIRPMGDVPECGQCRRAWLKLQRQRERDMRRGAE